MVREIYNIVRNVIVFVYRWFFVYVRQMSLKSDPGIFGFVFIIFVKILLTKTYLRNEDIVIMELWFMRAFGDIPLRCELENISMWSRIHGISSGYWSYCKTYTRCLRFVVFNFDSVPANHILVIQGYSADGIMQSTHFGEARLKYGKCMYNMNSSTPTTKSGSNNTLNTQGKDGDKPIEGISRGLIISKSILSTGIAFAQIICNVL